MTELLTTEGDVMDQLVSGLDKILNGIRGGRSETSTSPGLSILREARGRAPMVPTAHGGLARAFCVCLVETGSADPMPGVVRTAPVVSVDDMEGVRDRAG